MRNLLLSLMIFFLLPAAALAAADLKPLVVSGRVADQGNHAVAHAEVLLRESDTGKVFHTKTNGHGEFFLEHPRSGTCELQVIPPSKSALAQSLLSNVPGDEDRHVLVSVKPGFRLSGRVMCAGQPLKDVVVRATDDVAGTMHGAACGSTNGHGLFSFTVCPGRKTLEVINNSHQEASGLYKQAVTITSDQRLPDLNVPGNVAIGSTP